MSLIPFKVFVSTLAFACASTAIAAPKVGDSATMDGALVGQGMNAKVTAIQKITAYNANTGVFTILQSQTISGQAQSREVQVTIDDMMTEENAAQIVLNCESQSIGKKERVTVTAGAFDTCRVSGENGSLLWIATVPFGVVKLQSKTSVGTLNLSASAFARGI